jgi:SsrA-binding protein
MVKALRPNDSLIAENRRARFDYAVSDTFEAGIVLTGSEVKSLRLGQAEIASSYAGIDRDQILKIFGMFIEEYKQAGPHLQHEPRRVRTLLLKQKELRKITIALTREGMTLVPLKLYFTKQGKAKLLLGLAKGKNAADKRETIKERDWNKEKARTLREKNR